jgi:ribonuclease T1
MKNKILLSLFLPIVLLAGISGPADAQPKKSNSCEVVVSELNQHLSPKIDEGELVSVLRRLNETNNKRLPARFVTKKQAQKLGWRPGRDLWDSKELVGKSIGGDVFSNREGRLPDGRRAWREADLDYKGGHRGSKRIIYSDDGLRSVTVDHYNTFKAVSPCE